eukprot:s4700_g2.t1
MQYWYWFRGTGQGWAKGSKDRAGKQKCQAQEKMRDDWLESTKGKGKKEEEGKWFPFPKKEEEGKTKGKGKKEEEEKNKGKGSDEVIEITEDNIEPSYQ